MSSLHLQYQYFLSLNIISFHDFGEKNYLILYVKQNKSESEKSVTSFKRAAK